MPRRRRAAAARPAPPDPRRCAAAGTAYACTAFRVAVAGPGRLPPAPGTLLVVTHRGDDDVPVLGAAMYRAGLWHAGRGAAWPHFASRDDLFERGALAGVAPRLPRSAARVLWPVSIAGALPRVRVHRLRRPDVVRLIQAVRAVPPATPLTEVLRGDAAAAIADAAAAAGLAAPRTAGDAQAAGLAAALWRTAGPGDLPPGLRDAVVRARTRASAAELRSLSRVLAAGETVVLFPEGATSVDGGIGPVLPGVEALLRHGRPARVQPVGLAYDPLVTGRRRVVVGVGRAVPGAEVAGADDVLALLRAAMPVTCGQGVAAALTAAAGGRTTPSAVEAVVRADARTHTRPVDPALRDDTRLAVTDALRAAVRAGLVTARGPGVLDVAAGAAGDDIVARLCRERLAAATPARTSPSPG